MRRELIWVVVIGISFGLIIAFGMWRINSSMTQPKQAVTSPTPSTQNPGTGLTITLDSPENNDVVTDSPVSITGITKPLAWVVVSGEKEDYILQSDEEGIVKQNVKLEPGINRIKATAFGSTGTQSIQKLLVVYSSSFQLKTIPSGVTTGSTSSESSIQQKVAQKVAAALDRPKAYLGVITDITSTTIQIKNPDSQIEQIAIGDDDITVVNSKGTVAKQVKITDVAIGDFIVAMGYVNGDKVLHAQRILISNPLADDDLRTYIGKVTKITSKSLTIADAVSGEESSIVPSKNTVIATLANGKTSNIKMSVIDVDDLIIYITDVENTPPTIRSVFDI